MRVRGADLGQFPKRLAAGIFAALLIGGFGSVASSQEVKKPKFGDWELQCDTPAGGTNQQCALTQTVRGEETSNVNLAVMVLKPKEAQNGVLRVIAPMSVFLLRGVSLKVDQNDIGRAEFFRCFPAGCFADVMIDDQLLQRLKSGRIATLVIYLTPYEGIRHLVNLLGFNEGYEKLNAF